MDVNAFALPGGFVYINRGVIAAAENECELAGVMAHEISHVVARHSVEQIQRAQNMNLGLGILGAVLGRGAGAGTGAGVDMARLGAELAANGMFMKFSRKAEKEADQLGATTMYDAGFDPRGMITFFERLNQLRRREPNRLEAFFSSHPNLNDRVENVSKTIRSQKRRRDLRRNSAEFDQVRVYLTGQHSRDTLPDPPPADRDLAPAKTHSRVRKF
jgi:predicted Zn-dependent protease